MRILERPIGNVTILDIEGRITVQDGATTFHEAVQRLVSQNHVDLLLNLQFVPYIDSTALGALVSAYATVARRGGRLRLLKPGTRVRDLLTITRLSTVFELYESEAQALAAFGGTG
jgi:anti-sigma B factor antagonist